MKKQKWWAPFSIGVAAGSSIGLGAAAIPVVREPNWSEVISAPGFWGPLGGATVAIIGVMWTSWTSDRREIRQSERSRQDKLVDARREAYAEILHASQERLTWGTQAQGIPAQVERAEKFADDVCERFKGGGLSVPEQQELIALLQVETEGVRSRQKEAAEVDARVSRAAQSVALLTDDGTLLEAAAHLGLGSGDATALRALFMQRARVEMGRPEFPVPSELVPPATPQGSAGAGSGGAVDQTAE